MRFYNLYPITLIVFFTSVVTFTMITMNPLLLIISLCGGWAAVRLIAGKINLWFYILILFSIGITNPIFSHNGETVLFFLFEQRITLEALIYGFFCGVLIVSIMLWFNLFSTVFQQDKISWLIGKLSPKTSVIFSMAIRFIPLFKENGKNIYNAQLSLGLFDTTTIRGKIKLWSNVFSALISLSIENAIETADAMHTRGFENTKRSAYNLIKYSTKDTVIISVTGILDLLTAYFFITGTSAFYYYPSIKFVNISGLPAVFYLIFAILCFLPVLIDVLEELKWKYLISKI